MSTAKVTVVGEDRASKQINDVSRSMEHAAAKGAAFGAVAGGAFAAVAQHVTGFAKDSIDAFANVGKQTNQLQRYIGGTVEDASRLRFAAKESGVGFEDLTKGLGKLEKTLVTASDKHKTVTTHVEVATGAWRKQTTIVKDAAGHFETVSKMVPVMKMESLSRAVTVTNPLIAKLGINVRDTAGHIRPMNDLLPEIADKFKDMPNGAEKTALALQLFGKGGMALMPFLNKGAEGIKELSKESDKFGLTLSSKDTAMVKENIVAKRQWHAAIEGVQVQMGRYLYPALTQVAKAMTAAIPQIQKFAGPLLKSLGQALTGQVIPALTSMFKVFSNDILPVLMAVAGWMGRHQTLVKSLAVGIGTLVLGLKAYAVYQTVVTKATAAWATIQAVLNGEMEANPIGLVVLAIAALAAGLIYAYKHSETFRNVVNSAFHAVAVAVDFVKDHWKAFATAFAFLLGGPIVGAIVLLVTHFGTVKRVAVEAFHAVTGAVSTAFNWIKGHWPLLLAILTGPIGLAVLGIVRFRDQMWNAFKALPGLIVRALAGLANILMAPFRAGVRLVSAQLSQVVGAVKAMPKRISSAASGMFDGIKNAFRAAIDWVIDRWNGLQFSIPGVDTHIPGVGKVGGFTLGTPDIPRLATGGIVTRPTIALVGEAGPEAVIPLGRGRGVSGGDININFNGVVTDPIATGREIERVLTRLRRERGTALGFA